jgi:hypothetical protein
MISLGAYPGCLVIHDCPRWLNTAAPAVNSDCANSVFSGSPTEKEIHL